jgi:hypothetical protein
VPASKKKLARVVEVDAETICAPAADVLVLALFAAADDP